MKRNLLVILVFFGVGLCIVFFARGFHHNESSSLNSDRIRVPNPNPIIKPLTFNYKAIRLAQLEHLGASDVIGANTFTDHSALYYDPEKLTDFDPLRLKKEGNFFRWESWNNQKMILTHKLNNLEGIRKTGYSIFVSLNGDGLIYVVHKPFYPLSYCSESYDRSISPTYVEIRFLNEGQVTFNRGWLRKQVVSICADLYTLKPEFTTTIKD